MTREEAIKNLNKHKTEFTCDFGWNTSVIESLDMAIKALEQESKWIPVSEKSPLEGQFVLCSIAEYADAVHRIIIAKYEKNSLYWDEFVTAWMHLPTPYEPKEREVSNG